LAQRLWHGDYDPACVREALARTLNVTAWRGSRLVGSVRILSDGYFIGTVTEMLVDPKFQRQGLGRPLMERAWEASPTSLLQVRELDMTPHTSHRTTRGPAAAPWRSMASASGRSPLSVATMSRFDWRNEYDARSFDSQTRQA